MSVGSQQVQAMLLRHVLLTEQGKVAHYLLQVV
jgi:hypothetical protein